MYFLSTPAIPTHWTRDESPALFDEQTLQLEPGDLLVAYSDGVTEARNPDGEEFGEERLLACVRGNCNLAPSELLQCVFYAVNEFSAGAAQGDDLTLLVLRFARC
jgi:sigma-B regulation protein RsbU (phosphoserine phosphatase)